MLLLQTSRYHIVILYLYLYLQTVVFVTTPQVISGYKRKILSSSPCFTLNFSNRIPNDDVKTDYSVIFTYSYLCYLQNADIKHDMRLIMYEGKIRGNIHLPVSKTLAFLKNTQPLKHPTIGIVQLLNCWSCLQYWEETSHNISSRWRTTFSCCLESIYNPWSCT